MPSGGACLSISLPAEPPVIREHEPMGRHSSWSAGGVARYYSEPTSAEEAQRLLACAKAAGLSVIWAGRGTNMLVSDAGFSGLIASYRAQRWQIDEQGSTALVRVEAGATMAGMARRLAAMGWAGLEWAEGLPGSVGGAVVGNAGCYGSDTAAVIESVELLIDGRIEQWPVERLGYGYRTSVLKDEGRRMNDEAAMPGFILHPSSLILVTTASFRLQRADPAALTARTAAIAAERKRKTPSGRSCGSVFKNPPADSAGRLIEAAGLKGRTSGGAEISQLHANYIINRNEANAADIQALIELAQAEVARQFGVTLELEVRIVA
jgi:UDP-N-acetylmuramate dehydrogenase